MYAKFKIVMYVNKQTALQIQKDHYAFRSLHTKEMDGTLFCEQSGICILDIVSQMKTSNIPTQKY